MYQMLRLFRPRFPKAVIRTSRIYERGQHQKTTRSSYPLGSILFNTYVLLFRLNAVALWRKKLTSLSRQ
jgi:hypothetical protein